MIEQVEARVAERRLGSHTATDQYVDVPVTEEIYPEYTWYYEVEGAKLKFDFNEGVVVPLARVKSPIISITTLEKNDEDPDDTADWETLTEGPGASSHFMLLTSGTKDLGYALWFYDEEPEPGPKRLRVDYSYGYNVDSDILADWCTLNVGVKILVARLGTNQPDGLASLEGGDLGTFMNTNYRDRIALYRAEILEIEALYFPRIPSEMDIAVEII